MQTGGGGVRGYRVCLYFSLNFPVNLKLIINRKFTKQKKNGHCSMFTYSFSFSCCLNEKTKICTSHLEFIALQKYVCMFQAPHHGSRSAKIRGSGMEWGILKSHQNSFLQSVPENVLKVVFQRCSSGDICFWREVRTHDL